MIATHLGIDVNEKLQFLEVEDEYYKYWLHTYKSSDLREIQMYFIKSELIQAVGRAGCSDTIAQLNFMHQFRSRRQ